MQRVLFCLSAAKGDCSPLPEREPKHPMRSRPLSGAVEAGSGAAVVVSGLSAWEGNERDPRKDGLTEMHDGCKM